MNPNLSDLLVGVAFLILGVVHVRFALLSRLWPQTPALDLSGELRPIPISRKRLRLMIRYRYEVAGQSYTSRRVSFLDPAFDEEDAAATLAALKRAGRVRYDPADPSRAVVLPLPWGLGIALLVGGAALCAWELVGPGALFTPPAESTLAHEAESEVR
jgi:hypothetical protein